MQMKQKDPRKAAPYLVQNSLICMQKKRIVFIIKIMNLWCRHNALVWNELLAEEENSIRNVNGINVIS